MSQPTGRRRAEAGRRRATAPPAGRRRAEPAGRRRAEPAGRRRAPARPRYGRIGALAVSLAVTAVAVAGGFGVLPTDADSADAAGAASALAPTVAQDRPDDGTTTGRSRSDARGTSSPGLVDTGRTEIAALSESTALPAGSGTGRRIVFSQSRQRVWLVERGGSVVRTYLVSGSVTDNLEPGTYAVYSRSRNAIGIDDSGTMEYFVRFTHGTQGAAIGFHTIPVDDGKPVQTLAQLGTPRSHGCIRQERTNAIALWDFAPIGTKVVVTA